ncbi:MAG TPA: hypothetical protein VM681_08215 [Candidatus Thermoplasmatota archaeon]|nr:hypothetical protein [Candidatus Thermoplasmatota archaeon]
MKDLDPALREWMSERADANEREAFFDSLSADAKDRFLAAFHEALHETREDREQAWNRATEAVLNRRSEASDAGRAEPGAGVGAP